MDFSLSKQATAHSRIPLKTSNSTLPHILQHQFLDTQLLHKQPMVMVRLAQVQLMEQEEGSTLASELQRASVGEWEKAVG